MQYIDFALWVQRREAELDGGASLAWWSARLSGAPELLELPLDRPRPRVQNAPECRLPVTSDAANGRELRALCAREGATPLCGLLAAWAALLCRLSRQSELVLGQPHSMRHEARRPGPPHNP